MMEAAHLTNLFSIIKIFEEASRLNSNLHKTEMMGINLVDRELDLLANRFVCKRASWPNSYLGLPFNGKPHSTSFWDPILEKIRKKFSSWENSLISKGDRLTLLQATLSNLPIDYLSLSHPIKGGKWIGENDENFLWKGNNTNRGQHLGVFFVNNMTNPWGTFSFHATSHPNYGFDLLSSFGWPSFFHQTYTLPYLLLSRVTHFLTKQRFSGCILCVPCCGRSGWKETVGSFKEKSYLPKAFLNL